MKLSLCLIVSPTDKEAARLARCLASVQGVFDEICITITGENEKVRLAAENHGAKVSYFKWVDDFAAARTFNFKQATGDWIMWLDSDDVVRGANNIRPNVELADKNGVNGLQMLYHYSHNEQGQVEDSHWKTQLIKNDGSTKWVGIIHEDLLEAGPCKWATINDVIRVHTATKADSSASLARNIVILEREIERDPEEPRNYVYAAHCYLGLGRYDDVLRAVSGFLKRSGWDQERYEAHNIAGEALMRLNRLDDALRAHNDAILELEDAPDAYIYKARIYTMKQEWLKALTCLESAELKDKDAVILKRSYLYDHDLYLLSALAFIHTGMYRQGLEAAQKAAKNRPTEQALEMVKLAEELTRKEELTKDYLRLLDRVLGEPEKVMAVISTMPDDLRDDPRVLRYQFGAEPIIEHGPDDVTVYCGNTVEEWDGGSLDGKGIGGSETAVVKIAEELAKRGKNVTVYCKCEAPAKGTVVRGVTYKNFWQFNRLHKYNILWLWRSAALIDYDIIAKKVIVDLHDVIPDHEFTPERLAKIDHVFVKSEYHKSLLPSIPVDKFVVVGNGIDLSRFVKDKQKDLKRFVYTSTPNRGLEHLLDMWPRIRHHIPDAELHVYYGWNTFYEMQKHNAPQMAWMGMMQEKMKQPGIVNHGRKGQRELAKDLAVSFLWLYPTEFTEIHCITALEMQAARVYPITTGFAALAETQQAGVKLPGKPTDEGWQDKFVQEVVFAYENPDTLRKELDKGVKYAESCSWERVTDRWVSILWS